MNKKKSILECNVLYTIIAIIIGFLVGAIFLTIAGISPAVAYGKLFSSIFGLLKILSNSLPYATAGLIPAIRRNIAPTRKPAMIATMV